jgi:aspartate dehydrogenase
MTQLSLRNIHMRIGIIGGGTIARMFVEHIRRGDLGRSRVIAIAGRSERSRGRDIAKSFRVPFVIGAKALLGKKPDVVVEAASHDAVREYGEALLKKGVALIVLSCGALCDDTLRKKLERAAERSGALLSVPSGGIGGLDALKAACVAGVEEVTIAVTKPPAAWKGIPYVERLEIDLDRLRGPHVLFEGAAREGVPHFPANVNIAAVLSMAGIGFDKTRLKVVADPALKYNTHYIEVRGRTGRFSIKLENVPAPENPKTAWLACYSALAALKAVRSPVRYGT